MIVEFSGEIWYWRGPSPFYFVHVPEAESAHLQEISTAVSYGWGMIPVKARIRKAEALEEGDSVTVRLAVAV